MNGGKRLGAGRKHGRQNLVSQNLRERILAEGISPLEYILKVMRDPKQDKAVRLDAAKAAAPFIHPKLQSVEHTSTDGPGHPTQIEVIFVTAETRPREQPVLIHTPQAQSAPTPKRIQHGPLHHQPEPQAQGQDASLTVDEILWGDEVSAPVFISK